MAEKKPKPERKPRRIAEAFKAAKTARQRAEDPDTDRFPALQKGLDAIDEKRGRG